MKKDSISILPLIGTVFTIFLTPLLTSKCVDQKLEDYKLQAEHREQASKIAKYISLVRTSDMGNCGSTPIPQMSDACRERYEEMQQLSIELFLYSPANGDNFYENLGQGVTGNGEAFCRALAQARDSIMGIEEPDHHTSINLCKSYIIVNFPNIGKQKTQ